MADAAAPSLQRSMETFRRSGSSGLVWQDRFPPADTSRAKNREEGAELKELRPSQSAGTAGQLERSHSNGGPRPCRAGRVSPALDPPSPRVSAFVCCGLFGNSGAAKKPRPPRRRQ